MLQPSFIRPDMEEPHPSCAQLSAFCLDLSLVRHILGKRNADLASYWARIAGKPSGPTDIGMRYLQAIDAFTPVLQKEVYSKFDEVRNFVHAERERALHTEVVGLCRSLGLLLYGMGQHSGAAVLIERANALDLSLNDNISKAAATGACQLARVRFGQGRHEESMQVLFKAVAIYKVCPRRFMTFEHDIVACALRMRAHPPFILLAPVIRHLRQTTRPSKSTTLLL